MRIVKEQLDKLKKIKNEANLKEPDTERESCRKMVRALQDHGKDQNGCVVYDEAREAIVFVMRNNNHPEDDEISNALTELIDQVRDRFGNCFYVYNAKVLAEHDKALAVETTSNQL